MAEQLSKDLFDGGVLRRRPVRYVRAGEDVERAGEVVTGVHSGYYVARIWLDGKEVTDFRGGTTYPVLQARQDSAERAEELAVEDLRNRLQSNGGRLLPDA